MGFFPFNTRFSAPVTVASSFICGVALAIGHHCFYQNLQGQRVPETSNFLSQITPYDVSDQQFNVSVGTVFAFLVKALLGVAVSTVFNQLAWIAVKTRTPKITVIDDLFSVMSNGFLVLEMPLWRHYPLAMTLASIFWLLPIASVVTPATLNVRVGILSNSTKMQVPRVDFTSLNFVNLQPTAYARRAFMYKGPTYAVEKVVTASMTQGNILSIDPPSINSSWTLDFHGPALNCQPVGPDMQRNVLQNINDSYQQSIAGNDRPHPYISYGYLSWSRGTGSNGSLPFLREVHDNSTTYSLQSNTTGPNVGLFDKGGSPLSLFVAVFPHMGTSNDFEWENLLPTFRDSSMLQCTLYNASYSAQVRYINGDQTFNISQVKHLNDVSYLSGATAEIFCPWQTPHPAREECTNGWNTTVVENFSYQAIMDAFGTVIEGSIANIIVPAYESINTTNTQVMTTSLSETKELAFLLKHQSHVSQGNIEKFWNGDSIALSANPSASLRQSLEESFQNITFSLMSSPALQPNYSSPYRPSDTNVTFTTTSTVYAYSQRILWLAYGIAIGVTFVITLLGVGIYFINHGSYSFKFSTILRTTREAMLSMPLRTEDMGGLDPLPDYISQMKIMFLGAKKEIEPSKEGSDDD